MKCFTKRKFIMLSVIPVAVILICGYIVASNLYLRFADFDSKHFAPEFLTEARESKSVIDGRININTADAETLTLIDGIGDGLAEAIIAKRTEIGGFKTIDEIRLVDGIGKGIYKKISNYITVGDEGE